MKIIKIEEVSEFPLYDISVENEHCFELENGVIAHNSMYPKAIVSGGCLTENTKIRMADGTTRNIQDVKEGELVQTRSGPRKVSATWNPETLEEGTPECFELVFEDGYTVRCSDKHPFLVRMSDGSEKWVMAKDLTYDMEFIRH